MNQELRYLQVKVANILHNNEGANASRGRGHHDRHDKHANHNHNDDVTIHFLSFAFVSSRYF